jgi:hypothetical protein
MLLPYARVEPITRELLDKRNRPNITITTKDLNDPLKFYSHHLKDEARVYTYLDNEYELVQDYSNGLLTNTRTRPNNTPTAIPDNYTKLVIHVFALESRKAFGTGMDVKVKVLKESYYVFSNNDSTSTIY